MSLSEWGIDDKKFSIIIERLNNKKIGEFPLNGNQIKNILTNSIK
jgi:hypothetical protein